MRDILKSVYIACFTVSELGLLSAAIIKPEWWGAFLAIAFFSSWGFSDRLDKWGL